MYWGDWPWRELHLVAFSTETAKIWRRDLQEIVDNLPHSEESSIDYWLQCVYVELSRQGGGSVHALTALSNFGGVRMWRAYNVRICRLYDFYNFSALTPLDTMHTLSHYTRCLRTCWGVILSSRHTLTKRCRVCLSRPFKHFILLTLPLNVQIFRRYTHHMLRALPATPLLHLVQSVLARQKRRVIVAPSLLPAARGDPV